MELKVIVETIDFAAKKHKDQRRKDIERTPYINHPIGKKIINFTVICFIE